MYLSARNKETWFHLIAILTVSIWGSTFIATKSLINHGLTPVEIFTYRFSLPMYACLPSAIGKCWLTAGVTKVSFCWQD